MHCDTVGGKGRGAGSPLAKRYQDFLVLTMYLTLCEEQPRLPSMSGTEGGELCRTIEDTLSLILIRADT